MRYKLSRRHGTNIYTYIHTYIHTYSYIWDIRNRCSNSTFVSMLKHFKTVMANTFKYVHT